MYLNVEHFHFVLDTFAQYPCCRK